MGLTTLTLDVAAPHAPERDRGDAIFYYAGRRGAAPVIFAEPDDASLLGAVTLESLGLVLDAIRRDLLPLPMVIATAA